MSHLGVRVNDEIDLAVSAHGYVRSEELPTTFAGAAERLRLNEGWPDPLLDGERVLRADLALLGACVRIRH